MGCIVPQQIEEKPVKRNTPPIIESFSPREGYVVLQPGEEKIFSVDKVEDEDPNNLTYLWKLDNEVISDGTFVRIMAPNTSKIMELEVIVDDSQYQDMVRWTIIVGSP